MVAHEQLIRFRQRHCLSHDFLQVTDANQLIAQTYNDIDHRGFNDAFKRMVVISK